MCQPHSANTSLPCARAQGKCVNTLALVHTYCLLHSGWQLICGDSQILTVLYKHSIGFRPDPPLPARVGYARLVYVGVALIQVHVWVYWPRGTVMPVWEWLVIFVL